MADLLCLGEPLIEFNQLPSGEFLQSYGGDISNTAIAAARQGAKAGILTQLGGDLFADSLRELWRREGVGAEHVLTSQTRETGLYFVTHDDEGHHFTYRRNGSAASRYTPEDLPLEALQTGHIFYASGISLAISRSSCNAVIVGAKALKSAGGKFAFDPNLRTALWPLEQARETIHSVMKLCDIALPGLDDARHLTGIGEPDGIIRFYHNLGASIVALTLGDKGAIVSDGNQQFHISPQKVRALDATGAGDCFNGAFLAGLLRGRAPRDAAVWANAAAALSACGYGAVAPIPNLSQTRHHLRKTGEYHAD
ncbi:sugar kinase [Phaeobacter gallaeciensis]|uniref:Sugar kinase, ribokinase family n=1 Tax=Phaeobacter gallaeciensis TaxID=60890 RepID=A0AAD0EEY5_9RHOB|nr:sugar kinase [Phaeobacter gallaeciensis]AHD11854.1 Sugar kinase, ribokinase family [Phaeobacter gallaeciensis DSM 26640]ATE95117.1 Sugar kinase, ribokinase family [Phaeobacter gallaeciensis]ATE99425.1 Sugar kinase, ribokinase family [Phaeobacter gallaeciensis]ATF03822.1 Sugar kinase, ribokinase family [Phaeobacter gallaeciensis]ATF08015.1 Sugar kinase, ribokinase family [Phaeobacter gallaeciensis]